MGKIAMPLQVLIYVLAFLSASTYAQGPTSITSDGTLGTTVTQTGNVFDIDGGTIRGANQFHSFGDFSVGTGDVASFNGPAGIKNIVSRVTGGMPSDIDGTVASTISGASLYLLNPAGILIGPNAQLSVDGSFHASTADYLKLGDGGVFFADPGGTSVLTAAPPAAFGFLNAPAAGIDVTTPGVLQVAPGETLSLVGGDVTLGAPDGSAPAYVLAPGGNVNLVSVASDGEASIETDGSISANGFSGLGNIQLQGNSIVDGKNVYVRAGQFVIDNGVILPGAFSFFGLAPPPDGGTVNVKVSNDITITGTAPEPVLEQRPGIAAFAGDFSTGTAPAAKVPDISIDAGSLNISGAGIIEVARVGPGDPGAVTITADSVELRDGGTISALNAYDGPGTSVTINAQDMTLDGSGSSDLTRITTSGVFHPAYPAEVDPALTTASGGPITINATNDLVVRNAQITSEGQSFGGSADINITSADATFDSTGTTFEGNGGTSGPTRTIVSTQSSFSGDAGDISLSIDGSLNITNGAVISVNTLGSGDSGNLTVDAGEAVNITGQASGLASQTVPPLDEQLDPFAQLFELPDIASLREALGLPPDADLFAVLGALNDFGLTAVDDLTPGDGGTISVTTPALAIRDQDAAIDSSTAWDGNGGNVLLNVNKLVMGNSAAINSRSGISRIDTGELLVGSGNGGDISVIADNSVSLRSGAIISTKSQGTGLAGNISIDAGKKLDISDSSISTQATVSDGGNIEITARERVYLFNSDITTSVESGLGGGGNITIDPQFVILNQSNILANAFGGPGGNITIIADNVINSAQSSIDASSALGINGTVNISSPDQEVAQELAVLPENFLDVTGLISDRCGTAAGTSSLVSAGPGGLAVDPDGYLPSFGAMTNAVYNGDGENSAINSGKPWWALAVDTSALQLAQATCPR
jgi:filamentous hemagglutinin family protein